MNNTFNANSLLEYGEKSQETHQSTSSQSENLLDNQEFFAEEQNSSKKQNKKDSGTLLKIGTVAKMFDINTSVLRFWEEEFAELEPLRTSKGQRLYSTKDIALIKKIRKLLHVEGLTIEGAKKSLAKGQLPKGRIDARPKLGNIPTLSLHQKENQKANIKEENQAAKILQQSLNTQKEKLAKSNAEEVALLQSIAQELLEIKKMLSLSE